MSERSAPRYDTVPGGLSTAVNGVMPSQTVGPFWHIGLPWEDGAELAPPGTSGRVSMEITVLDGAGDPIADAMVETWQADALGRFAHAADPRGAAAPSPTGFRAFGRCGADDSGTARLVTVKPGALPTELEVWQAPHVTVSIFARGILRHLVTRLYFPEDSAGHAHDPVLQSLPVAARDLLIAERTAEGYAWTVRVQGGAAGAETPFFDV